MRLIRKFVAKLKIENGNESTTFFYNNHNLFYFK